MSAPSGRLELEPKDKTKARLGRSPDRSDALVMAIAGPGQPPSVMAVSIPNYWTNDATGEIHYGSPWDV